MSRRAGSAKKPVAGAPLPAGGGMATMGKDSQDDVSMQYEGVRQNCRACPSLPV
jgi:hypothetical protein